MCGRFVLEQLLELSDTHIEYRGPHDFPLFPTWNAAPSQILPVIIPEGGEADQLALIGMRWGLVPRWTTSGTTPKFAPINARSESVTEKGMFRHLVSRNRAVIPANGFYEWKRGGTSKRPYYVQPTEGIMMWFAGLYDEAIDAEGQPFRSFTILTTDANGPMSEIHDRMPVILPEDAVTDWLDPMMTDFRAFDDLLEPAPDDAITMHPVSPAVNNPRHNTPDLVEPVSEQPSLFPIDHDEDDAPS